MIYSEAADADLYMIRVE